MQNSKLFISFYLFLLIFFGGQKSKLFEFSVNYSKNRITILTENDNQGKIRFGIFEECLVNLPPLLFESENFPNSSRYMI